MASSPKSPYLSGGAKIVSAKSESSPVRSVCGAPAGNVTRSPALISHSLPETRAVARSSIMVDDLVAAVAVIVAEMGAKGEHYHFTLPGLPEHMRRQLRAVSTI